MTAIEFKDYACSVSGNIVKNVINGRWTRIDESFNETSDLQAVHHICVLGIGPPDDLEDLYEVYLPVYLKQVSSESE